MLTGAQMEAKSKTVTRRLNWLHAKPGMEVLAVSQCQGLKAGQKAKVYGVIRFTDVRRESLLKLRGIYGITEAGKEGFPQFTGVDFIKMFCRHMKVTPDTAVTRIEFEYLAQKVEP